MLMMMIIIIIYVNLLPRALATEHVRLRERYLDSNQGLGGERAGISRV